MVNILTTVLHVERLMDLSIVPGPFGQKRSTIVWIWSCERTVAFEISPFLSADSLLAPDKIRLIVGDWVGEGVWWF